MSIAELILEHLAGWLQEYQRDCARLLLIEEEIRSLRSELHAGGLTKYQDAEDSDTEMLRIIKFARLLP